MLWINMPRIVLIIITKSRTFSIFSCIFEENILQYLIRAAMWHRSSFFWTQKISIEESNVLTNDEAVLQYSPTRRLTHSSTHSLTRSLTHLLTHSFVQSLTWTHPWTHNYFIFFLSGLLIYIVLLLVVKAGDYTWQVEYLYLTGMLTHSLSHSRTYLLTYHLVDDCNDYTVTGAVALLMGKCIQSGF